MKYYNIQKPLVIRNKVLKNRIIASNSLPHFLQGPESYPADPVIAHYENKAKNSAVTTVMGINNFSRGKQLPMFVDFGHFPDYDLYDANSQNYLMHLADCIHYYQSLACMAIFVGPPSSYPLMHYLDPKHSSFGDAPFEIELIPAHKKVEEYDIELLNKIADSYAEQCAILKRLDYDMASIHMCYRGNLPAKFFSPATNHREDEFGGSLENRMKFPLMVLKRIRERVGNDFLIEIEWSIYEEDGYPIEESIAFLNEAKKYIDLVQLRAGEVDVAHPLGFELRETPFLEDCIHIKENVPDLIIGSVGGYQDLDTIEEALNHIDLIYAARAFISNTNYIDLIKEGANDDLVPCLRCNKCHGRGVNDPFISVCSVNPIIGLEHKIDRMISPVTKIKKVAIIGGGPAGMRCAIFLRQRGHQVTIYEKEHELGGMIRHSDYVDFKWPLKKYKDYLIYQMNKLNVEVHLNTLATPEMIKDQYDVIIASTGSKAIVPPLKGLEEYMFAYQAFKDETKLQKSVVIIGGGEIGVECAIHLARHGHNVKIVEMKSKLASEATHIHYYKTLKENWEKEANIEIYTQSKVIEIDHSNIVLEQNGNKEIIKGDSIVLAAGMKAKREEALAFYGCAKEFYLLGDASKVATLQQANRQAFAIASQI